MFENFRIANLPPYGKLFVGLFTALLLCVCCWAMLILYVDKGMVSPDEIPSYVKQPYGPADTTTVKEKPAEQKPQRSPEEIERMRQRRLKHNVQLAHTHINGQTLLFFAIGLVFLFTSAKPKIKTMTLWVFAVSVVVHNIGLTGQHYYWFFDEILAISGVLILGSIAYMAFFIYADLLRKPVTTSPAE